MVKNTFNMEIKYNFKHRNKQNIVKLKFWWFLLYCRMFDIPKFNELWIKNTRQWKVIWNNNNPKKKWAFIVEYSRLFTKDHKDLKSKEMEIKITACFHSFNLNFRKFDLLLEEWEVLWKFLWNWKLWDCVMNELYILGIR